MKTNKQKLLENKIYLLVKESVSEMLNGPGRDPSGREDGKYSYQGTGSPESNKRMEKLRKTPAYDSRQPKSYTDHIGKKKSAYRTMRGDYGKFETMPDSEDKGVNWDMFIDSLRNRASRNGYEPVSYEDKFIDLLGTKEGAKSFIKYLFKNGFNGREMD